MNQEERDALLSKDLLFTANLPICIWLNDAGKFYATCVMPRKETCFDTDPFETDEELEAYCDLAIAAYENAVELFKLLKQRRIDHIYYFDSPATYLQDATATEQKEASNE